MNGQEKLQALVKKYVDGLGERWAVFSARYGEIMGAIAAQQDLRHLEALSLLHYDTHKLAGSAGSMGLEDLGKAAGALDVYMSAVQMRGDSFNDVDLKQFSALYNVLETSLCNQSWASSSILNDEAERRILTVVRPVAPMNAHRVVAVGDWPLLTADIAAHLEPFGLILDCIELDQVAVAMAQSETAMIMIDQTLVGGVVLNKDVSLPVLAVGDNEKLSERIALVHAGFHALVPLPVDAFDVVDLLDRYRTAVDSKPVKVVLVDDDPALVSLLDYQLTTAGMEVVSLESPDGLFDVLGTAQPEVLILDRNMPMWDGFDVAMVIRQVPAYADLPLVFLTADQRPDSRLTALALGGDDYLHKPVDGLHLATLVRARALRARALRQKIVTDGLTGLLNHMALITEAQHHCALARRLKRPLSVAIIDLDHFKSVNDIHGHQAGDNVLRGLSRMLRQRLRRSDVIGRMGGEEFAIVMPDTSAQQAVQVIEVLRQAFSQLDYAAGGKAFQVTFSAGVAGTRPCGLECPKNGSKSEVVVCDDVAALVRRADEALYDAKHHGRNRISLAQS